MPGQEHSRLQSCSRWPEKGNCEQDCLVQVDQSPENLERLFAKGMRQELCYLHPPDHSVGLATRPARSFEPAAELFELRDMSPDDLEAVLAQTRPLCLQCHQGERQRQAGPRLVLKGDRFGLASLHDTV